MPSSVAVTRVTRCPWPCKATLRFNPLYPGHEEPRACHSHSSMEGVRSGGWQQASKVPGQERSSRRAVCACVPPGCAAAARCARPGRTPGCQTSRWSAGSRPAAAQCRQWRLRCTTQTAVKDISSCVNFCVYFSNMLPGEGCHACWWLQICRQAVHAGRGLHRVDSPPVGSEVTVPTCALATSCRSRWSHILTVPTTHTTSTRLRYSRAHRHQHGLLAHCSGSGVGAGGGAAGRIMDLCHRLRHTE